MIQAAQRGAIPDLKKKMPHDGTSDWWVKLQEDTTINFLIIIISPR